MVSQGRARGHKRRGNAKNLRVQRKVDQTPEFGGGFPLETGIR